MTAIHDWVYQHPWAALLPVLFVGVAAVISAYRLAVAGLYRKR